MFPMILVIENWLDILAFVSRARLGRAVSIVSRQFCSLAHRVLHEEGKVVLGELRIEEHYNDGNRQAVLVNKRHERVPFPTVPMPRNVVDFEALHISYVDDKVIALLKRMHPLLNNVHLCFQICNLGHQTTVAMWHKLMPLFDEPVECIFGDEDVNQIICRELQYTMMQQRCLQAGIVKQLFASHAQFYLEWLTHAGNATAARPRMLIGESASGREMIKFYEAVHDVCNKNNNSKNHFQSAKVARSFLILLETLETTAIWWRHYSMGKKRWSNSIDRTWRPRKCCAHKKWQNKRKIRQTHHRNNSTSEGMRHFRTRNGWQTMSASCSPSLIPNIICIGRSRSRSSVFDGQRDGWCVCGHILATGQKSRKTMSFYSIKSDHYYMLRCIELTHPVIIIIISLYDRSHHSPIFLTFPHYCHPTNQPFLICISRSPLPNKHSYNKTDLKHQYSMDF